MLAPGELFNNLLGIAIIVIVFIYVIAKIRKKTFKEMLEEVKEFMGSKDGG